MSIKCFNFKEKYFYEKIFKREYNRTNIYKWDGIKTWKGYKINSKDLNVVIDAMQEFGDTKTLSSPRISALNNQKAKLDFINTLVYFSYFGIKKLKERMVY